MSKDGLPRRRLLVLIPILAGSAVAAADGGAVYQRDREDGTIELTNIPDTPGDYQTIIAAPPAATGPERGQVAAPAEPRKPISISDGPMGDRLRELYSGAHAAHQAAGR